jgi:hypothetical protein
VFYWEPERHRVSDLPPSPDDSPAHGHGPGNRPFPGQPQDPPPRRRRSGGPWPWAIGAMLLLVIAATVLVVVLRGGEEEAKAQTVRFQQPTDVGPDPFLEKPADRKGKRKLKVTPSSPDVGAGPFGGSGSDLVCDRDLLIESLKARPERLVEWARVLGVKPTIKAVGTYIAKLHPVTLTRDTRVTNHSFVNGRAVGFQAILAAGTAVLVDDYGNPVVRCRCGNPLLKPIFIPTATCTACPPRYEPPPPCPYTEEVTYRRRWYPGKYYSNDSYDEVFIRRFRSPCYRAYPAPPRVTITDIFDPDLKPTPTPTATRTPKPTPERPPEQPPEQVPAPAPTNPAASFSPSSGPVCRAYTLSASGFTPNRTLSITLVRPDGVNESYSMTTGPDGSSSYTFSPGPNCANVVQGVYTATVRDPQSDDSAQATVGVSGGGGGGGGGGGDEAGGGTEELQCDPARSQLEFEQCRDAGLP